MSSLVILSPSLSGGGAEKVAVNLANHWAVSGHDVNLITLVRDDDYKSLLNSDVAYHDINAGRLRYSLVKLARCLSKLKPDAVLSVIRGSNVVLGICPIYWLKGTQFVFREASTLDKVLKGTRLRRAVSLSLMRFLYSRADKVIANSRETLKDLNDWGIAKGNGEVISNPVLPSNYQTLADESLYGWEGDEEVLDWFGDPCIKVIVSAGRLTEEKNFEFLLSVFESIGERCPEARLVVLGDGEKKEELVRQCESLGIQGKVRFVGFRSNPFPYYKNANVFALSPRWEGFGNVLVESLAVGTPVVCSNCRGGPAFILGEGRYGALVEPGDKEAFVDAVLRELFLSGKDREKLVSRAGEFTVGAVADRYLGAMNVERARFMKTL